MKRFLGFDQSYTSSGYCIINEDGGLVELGAIKTNEATHGDIYDRAALVSRSALELCSRYTPAKVGLEGLAFSKFGNATRDLAGLQFVLITQFRASPHGEKISIVSPNLLKKFATEKGNANKQDMVDVLPQHIQEHIASLKFKKSTGLYDIADAYWIAQYTLAQWKKEQQ